MSVARGFGINGKSYYTNVCGPRVVHCNFIVDPANGNGLGQRSLKSNGFIEQIFLHSTASFTGTVTNTSFNITGIASGTSSFLVGMPVQGTNIPAGTVITQILSSSSVAMSAAATGTATESITYQGVTPDGFPSPNPASGLAWVQFKNNFNYYLGGFTGFVSPPTGSATSSITRGTSYQIAALGTATLAQWQTAGIPPGLTPSLNMSFVAATTESLPGSATVYATGVSGITSVEAVGDPNQSLSNSNIAKYAGAWVLVQFLGATSSTSTVLIPTAPATNSVVGMTFYFDGSSVTVDGL